MKRTDIGTCVGAFAVGLGVGIAVSLLTAPQSGEKTRDFITKRVRRGQDLLGDAADQIRTQTTSTFQEAKSRLREAVEGGREAYRDELSQRPNS